MSDRRTALFQVSYHDDIEKEMKMRVSLVVLGKFVKACMPRKSASFTVFAT